MNINTFIFRLFCTRTDDFPESSCGKLSVRKRILFYVLMCIVSMVDVSGQAVSDCLQLRNYEADEENLKTALKANIKNFGENHSSVVQNRFELARLYQELGQYDKAERLLQDALDAAVEDYGKVHPKTAKCQLEFARLYILKGQYLVAKKLSETALITNEKILQDHVSTAASCMVLAEVCQQLGQYGRAQNLLERAVNIHIKVLGDDHILVAKSQSELALLYHTLGDDEKAQALFELVIANDFKGADEHDIDLSNYQSNLADVYFKLKKYEKSRGILEKTLEGDLKKLCKDHPKIARHQSNLSKVYFRLGKYGRAKDLVKLALTSNLKHYGTKHPIVSKNYVDLALIYQILGEEYDLELPMENIPGIKTDASGKKIKKTLKDLAQVAGLIRGGHYDETGTYNNHPVLKILDILINVNDQYKWFDGEVASSYVANESYQNAKQLWGHIIVNTVKGIHEHCRLLPAEERLMYIQKQAEIFDKFYSFGSRHQDNEVFYQIMYASGAIKSIGLDYSRSLRRLILQSKDKKLIKLYHQYTAKTKLLGQAYLLTQKELEQKKWDIEAIKKEVNRLEADLLKSERVRVFSGNLLVKDFKKTYLWMALLAGTIETLIGTETEESSTTYRGTSTSRGVDFIRFNYHNGKYFTDSMLYYALIYNDFETSRRDELELLKGIYFIPLTDEETLAPLLEVREGDYLPIYMRSKEERKKIYNLIWKPLERHLRGVQYLKLSPTGLLHGLDFGVLQDNSEQYLNERFEFHYGAAFRESRMSDGYLYVRGKRVIKPYKGALLIGNIAYDKTQTTQRQKDENEYDGVVMRDTRTGIKPLPGTLEEVKAIEKICRKKRMATDLLTADTPTEDTLQYLSGVSPDIIHIATHGFSLNPLYDDKRVFGESLDLKDRIRYADNPLQRCGLMLYGANETWKKSDKLIDPKKDGILTGLEVTEMDLSRTRLVVLSACSSGLGSVHNTEGVFGLQRAFKLAGAKQVIVSLWPVDDEITKELMIIFYNNLLRKNQSAVTALHNAKAEMRRRNDTPYLWAGFILVE